MNNDYVDFKFGDHWASEFNLLAVSNSDRHNPPVYGSVNPNTATIMGKKGVYKWKTQVNEKIFNMNIAFDSVTIAQLNMIKQWLEPHKVQKLIFADEPYKYYWAALNSEIDFSFLPFIEGEKKVGERTIIEGVYKGEMVISFICIDNDGYSEEGTFEGLESEPELATAKGSNFTITDADNDYIEDLKIKGKSEQEVKYNNALSDTDFADVNNRSVKKEWKTNNLAQIQAENGEVTINAPYEYSGIAQEQRESIINHKYYASAEVNTDSLDTALEIAGKNITNSIEGKDINITDGLVGPVDDLVVSGDASQDKLYNNEINNSFLEDLDNWNNQNNGQISINKQKATVIANEKYSGVSQRTEENNVGDKYYVRAKVQSNNIETALEVETEKGSAEGSSITINDASDNKLENIRIEGKHSQEHYDQKDLGEGELISYNNADNYERYTKVSVSGNSAQKVVEEVPGTEVEGESITVQDITLPKGRIGVYGNSKQETRSGKNLFNIETATMYSGTKELTSDKTGFILRKSTNRINNYALTKKLQAGTYTIYFKIKLENSTYTKQNVGFVFKSENQSNVGATEYATSNGTYALKVTTDQEVSFLYCFINNGENANCVATITDFMILEGEHTIDENYERFGASPSLNHPSKIETVGNNINLLHMQEKSYTQLGVNVTQKESCLKLDGTTNGAQNILSGGFVDIGNFKKGKYSFKAHISGSFERQGKNDFAFYIRKKDDISKIYGSISGTTIENSRNSFTFELTEDTDLVIQIWANASGIIFNNFEMKLKVEEGETATSYSPYGQGSTEIKKVNKNFIPINFYESRNINGVNFINNGDGTITVNGTATANAFYAKDITLKSGTYTLSGSPTGASQDKYTIQALSLGVGDFGSGQTFTLEEETTVTIRIMIWSGITVNNLIFKPMIEKGNKKTKFEARKETNYILPIQQEMLLGDYFVKENDGWKEVHNWEKTIFNETDNFSVYITNAVFQFYLSTQVEKDSKLLCNMFLNKNDWISTSVVISSNSHLYFLIKKGEYGFTEDLSTEQALTKFKEIIEKNNIVLYNTTQTPIKLACTKEQIEVCEQIDETELFLDTTNIYSNDEIAPNFKLEYNYVLPSPSPEVPSEIKNIGSNINLIDKSQILHYSTYGSSLNSTVLKSNSEYSGYLFACKPNTNYTITRSDTESARFRGFCFDENPTENLNAISTNGFWADEVAGPVKQEATFKTTENSKYIYVVAGYNDKLSANVKAEEGSEATPYSEYNCGNVGITVCNKNLFNGDIKQLAFGTSGNNTVILANSAYRGCYIKIKKNAIYSVSRKKTTSRFRVAFTETKPSPMTLCFGGTGNINTYDNSYKIENLKAPENANYLFVYLSNSGESTEGLNLQIEENTITTEYVENQSQIITFPLSEEQKLMEGDYLARDGIHHVRKQIELDGTENISAYSKVYETGYGYRLSVSGGIKPNSSLYCTKYKNITFLEFYNATTNIIGKCSCHNTSNQFVYFGSSKSTLEEFKQEIAGSILEYELLEEEIEPYTPEQQEAYNNLTHLIMYNGQNTLSSSNELKPQLKWEIPESPSPDYPIEIKIIKDNIKMTSYSANELNLKILTVAETKECKVENKKENEITITSTAKIGGSYIRFKKKVKAGTWYFKKEFEILSGIDTNYTGRVFIQDTSWNNILILNKNLKEGSFTLKEDKELYITLIAKENIDTNTEIIKIKFYNLMLSNNNVDFVTYKQDNAIVPIQQEMLEEDYIDLKTNMEAHTWNYIELDGTENWVSEPGNLVNTFRARVGTGKTSNNYVGKSTHFNFVGNYNLDEPHMYATDAGALYIYINKEIANSLKELRAWLVEQKEKGTPVRVYWKANKTSETVLTSEQKTELQKLRSYREITNIISNDILQPNIKIEYIKKPSYTTKLTGNTEQLLSLIYQTNIDKTKILLNNISDNNNSFTFTHPILINLTKQFGSGREPTKEWLDTNIDFWDVAEGGAPSIETSSRVKTVGSNINLFDPDNHIELDGQYRHYSEGKIVNSANFFGIKVPVLGNTVYSVNSNLNRGGYSNLCYYNKDSVFMWGEPFTEGQTFRTPFNCRYITLALNKNYDWFTLTYGEIPIQKVDYNLANIDMQISGYDSQFKSFPLAKGQELLQLSDGTQDTLEADGIHKRVGKVEITGNENWSQYNRQLHTYFGATTHIAGANGPIFCNRLINNNTYVYNTTGEAAACLQENYLYMCIKRKDFGANDNMSVDECLPLFIQFLKNEHGKGNPFIYYYKKAEEIIPYSNAQKAWYDEFEIYRKNTQITTIAETKPWYSFTYDINDTYSVNSTKVNEYEKLGLIFNNLEDRPRFIVNRTADGSGTIKMRKPLVVDLTNAFGAGKEPDLAWCLENITFDNSCEYGTPSPNVPSELVSVGSNPIKIENKSRNLIKEQNLLNWTKEYCTAKRLTEKYDNRNIYRISFENHKKGTISTRIQQKKGDMVFSIYARVIQADNPTVNRLVVAKVTSDSSASTVVSHKSFENLIGEWQKIYIPITSITISDAAELVLEIQHNADTDDSTIIDLCMPQLEEGFTPHDYIPYAPNTINNLIFTEPLRQLPNGVRDELSKNGIIRRVGKYTIKPTNSIFVAMFNTNKQYITISGSLGIYVRGDSVWTAPSFYCNRFKDCIALYDIANNGTSSREKEGIGIIDGEYRLCMRADLIGVVSTDTRDDIIRKYKVWLADNPIEIYYEKEIPDLEQLTSLQLNTINNLVTRKLYNNWVISGVANPEVELTYKRSSSVNDIHPWVTGSNLLDKTWLYNDNNIHTKSYIEVETGDADKSGVSANRPVYLLNSGTTDADLNLKFDYISIVSPLTIRVTKGKMTDSGFSEIAPVSEITIKPFLNYQPFIDLYDNIPSNWYIEIDSTLGEVYLKHKTNESKVLNLNRFNDNHTFLTLASCNFVDYDKVFPTIISEIKDTAIENTVFNKLSVANAPEAYRLKNANIEWKHTYL